ncbi:MAG: hypothetical protein KKA79_10255 [Nanoarchaeota archaeon]|nr:hypothetical protein [Nanoarchaeota archaeon]
MNKKFLVIIGIIVILCVLLLSILLPTTWGDEKKPSEIYKEDKYYHKGDKIEIVGIITSIRQSYTVSGWTSIEIADEGSSGASENVFEAIGCGFPGDLRDTYHDGDKVKITYTVTEDGKDILDYWKFLGVKSDGSSAKIEKLTNWKYGLCCVSSVLLIIPIVLIIGKAIGKIAPSGVQGVHLHHHSCCLVGSAYYDPKSRELTILRKWRDEKLMKNRLGKVLVKTYYTLSPMFVMFIAKSEKLKAFTRMLVNPFVNLATATMNYEKDEGIVSVLA